MAEGSLSPRRSTESHRRRARQSGYTLLELLIVSILTAILVIASLQAWRFLSSESLSLRDRARSTTELRIAVAYLCRDLGGAAFLSVARDGGLLIRREEAVAVLEGTWRGKKDRGIEYGLSRAALIRRNRATKQKIVVAHGISSLDVRTDEEGVTYIDIATGHNSDQRMVTLAWIP